MEELQEKITQSIREVLKDVDIDTAQTIARHLTSREVGLKEIEQLKFVTSEDLSELSVIQGRQLVAAWNQLYGQEQQRHQEQPQRRERRRERGENQGEDVEDRWNFQVDWEDIYAINPKMKKRLDAGKKLTKLLRREVVKRIVNQVRNKVPGADRKIFLHIMREMKRKHGRSFRHELANGTAGNKTVVYYLQTRYDNSRRPARRTRVETEAPNLKAAYGCVKWRLMHLPTNQTQETQEAIRAELQETFTTLRQAAWNWDNIKEKMGLTYGTLRSEINKQALAIEKAKKAVQRRNRRRNQEQPEDENEDDPDAAITPTATLQEEWPFLFQPKGMMHHFSCLTEVDYAEKQRLFVENELDKTLELLVGKRRENKKFQKKVNKAIRRNAGNQNSLKLTALVVMLSNYFTENLKSMIEVIEAATNEEEITREITLPKTPLLVVAGPSILKPTNIYFISDGTVLGTAESMEQGIAMLFSAYYVFNLEYAPQAQVTLEFFQRCVAKINPTRGNKRPNKVKTVTANGHYSSRQVHHLLAKLSSEFEEFFADHDGSTDSTSSHHEEEDN